MINDIQSTRSFMRMFCFNIDSQKYSSNLIFNHRNNNISSCLLSEHYAIRNIHFQIHSTALYNERGRDVMREWAREREREREWERLGAFRAYIQWEIDKNNLIYIDLCHTHTHTHTHTHIYIYIYIRTSPRARCDKRSISRWCLTSFNSMFSLRLKSPLCPVICPLLEKEYLDSYLSQI